MAPRLPADLESLIGILSTARLVADSGLTFDDRTRISVPQPG
jgi:hypothetical protein